MKILAISLRRFKSYQSSNPRKYVKHLKISVFRAVMKGCTVRLQKKTVSSVVELVSHLRLPRNMAMGQKHGPKNE